MPLSTQATFIHFGPDPHPPPGGRGGGGAGSEKTGSHVGGEQSSPSGGRKGHTSTTVWLGGPTSVSPCDSPSPPPVPDVRRRQGRDSVVSHSEDRTEDTTPTAHTNGGSPVMRGRGGGEGGEGPGVATGRTMSRAGDLAAGEDCPEEKGALGENSTPPSPPHSQVFQI